MNINVPNQDSILDYYGIQNQTLIWMEELSELAKAVSKCFRQFDELRRSDVIEEIADVFICIEQMASYYKISPDSIQNVIQEKYERQLTRMGVAKNVNELIQLRKFLSKYICSFSDSNPGQLLVAVDEQGNPIARKSSDSSKCGTWEDLFEVFSNTQ